jgi:hypothetical protein
MAFLANIDLWFEGSDKQEKRVCTLLANIGSPSKSDLIHLESGRLFGTEISIDPKYVNLLSNDFRNIERGHYKFWATYYGRGVQDINCKEISLASNKVEMVVE